MRIAFFSPLRPIASGISDYSEELLPYLARGAEITLFVDGYLPSNPAIRRQFPIYEAGDFESVRKEERFDICLYHIGNGPCHAYMLPPLRLYGGVIMLHDAVLHHLLGYLLTECQDRAAFLAGFPEEVAAGLARRRQAGFFSGTDEFFFAGCREVVRRSHGVLVHSEYARRVALEAVPTARVQIVPHHWAPLVSPYAALPPERIKAKLGYERGTFLLVSPGIVSPARRIPQTLRIFQRLVQRFPQARLAVVGHDHPAVGVLSRAHELGLDGLVDLTGFIDVPTFQSYILAADVLINLRYPLAGETSGGLIRALGMGKPMLVSNVGQYAELPDDCVLKVDLGVGEEEMALAYLEALIEDPALGRRIGEQARRYIRSYHAIERSAQGYLDFLRAVLEDGQEAACTARSL